MSGEATGPPTDSRVLTGEVTVARPLSLDGGAAAPEHWPPPSRYGARAVAIANDAAGVVERAVASLAELPADLPRHALVGGLAVMIRLYVAHRVTTDFDEVSASPGATVATLVALGATRTSKGVELPDRGVQLDLLDAEVTLRDLEGLAGGLVDDDERRAWQLAAACRYALDTAVPTDIVVVERERVLARVSLPVALAGALVALKTHAVVAPDRPPDKAAADVYDIWRLVRAWGPTVIAEDLSRAPLAMLRTTAEQVRHIFTDDVERTAHRLRRASVPGVHAVSVDDLESVSVLDESLQPFLAWDPPGGVER